MVQAGGYLKKPRTIAVVTSSRADYCHLYWPLRELSQIPGVDLRIIAIGAHLSPEFGQTVQQVEQDGFTVAAKVECLLSSDSDVGMAKTIGIACLGLADTLGQLRPDLLVLIADRYEMLAPASVALALRIPIAHIEGGEITEGAIDNAVRNALTKMSHIHFTSTELARQRLIAMGEEEWRVHRAGAPSLDHLRRQRLLSRKELECRLRADLQSPYAVVAYHPVTMMRDTLLETDALFAALSSVPEQIMFCYPNADAGSRALINRARRFLAIRNRGRIWTNLDAVTYWSLLRHALLFIGNSSSGIMETPSFALPTVNIGLRQQGRERARNVLDVEPVADAILARVEIARSSVFRDSLNGMENPYGNGNAAGIIAKVLADTPLSPGILFKHSPRSRLKPSMRIPLAAPEITESDIAAVTGVLHTTRLSLGPVQEEFERSLAGYLGAPHAIAVSSGTSALHLCLRALGITGGDEVIVPSFTFVAAANAVRYQSAIPIFVDIEPQTLNMDPTRIEDAITSRTRAILAVHTFGCPAEMDDILEIARRHDLFVIEDACEALGAEYRGRKCGLAGDAGVFGFYPNKQITTGEGGAIVTGDADLAALIRGLRNQGRINGDAFAEHGELGYNYRISEINCALGNSQLRRIESILHRREAIARTYAGRLKGNRHIIPPPIEFPHRSISWFAFVVRLSSCLQQAARDGIVQEMAACGIECGRYFVPIHKQPLYQREPCRLHALPVTEWIADRSLALPFFNTIKECEIQEVCDTLSALVTKYAHTREGGLAVWA
jgi:UDP-hydrolysing UDP-N-acetyl-D-glucosamine 2-epimerase